MFVFSLFSFLFANIRTHTLEITPLVMSHRADQCLLSRDMLSKVCSENNSNPAPKILQVTGRSNSALVYVETWLSCKVRNKTFLHCFMSTFWTRNYVKLLSLSPKEEKKKSPQ